MIYGIPNFSDNDAVSDLAMDPSDSQHLFAAIGTPGGVTIATTIAQVLLDLLVFKRTPSEAIAAPRYSQQAVPEEIAYEQTRAPQPVIDALLAMGHGVRARDAIGDVQAIWMSGGKLLAISDARHGGAAGGF